MLEAVTQCGLTKNICSAVKALADHLRNQQEPLETEKYFKSK